MSRPRAVTDEQIHAAARSTFLAAGPTASVAAVAARLGVTAAALFQRVGTKEALLLAALEPGAPAVASQLERGPEPGRPPRAQLVPLLGALLAFHRQALPALLVLHGAGRSPALAPLEPPPVRLRRLLTGWLRRCRAQGVTVPHPGPVAELLLSAIEARCFNAALGGPRFSPGDDRRFVARLVAALLPAEAR
jgi:AcrR family transcriptional regulator